MGVNFDSSRIKILAADLERVPELATRHIIDAVQETAKRGNKIAADLARESAGAHGKHYHKAFQAERADLLGLTWVYGPNAAMPQGGMSFEGGSRNQPPHLDLAKSTDLIGPDFLRKVDDAIARAMW